MINLKFNDIPTKGEEPQGDIVMENKRALRRHHAKRMKAKAKMVAKLWWGFDDPRDINLAIKWADNLCPCSRWCCGNPRKWWKERTRKELESDLDFNEQANGRVPEME